MSNRTRRKVFKKQIVLLILILAAVFGSVYAYYDYKDKAEYVTAYFENSSSRSDQFIFEIAKTKEDVARGLMFRESLKPNHGMIFVFPNEEIQSFWMKNTYIPLDMIFIDSRFEVVGIVDNVPILNDRQRKISLPSKYVVELDAGTAKKNNIKNGSKLVIDKSALKTK